MSSHTGKVIDVLVCIQYIALVQKSEHTTETVAERDFSTSVNYNIDFHIQNMKEYVGFVITKLKIYVKDKK